MNSNQINLDQICAKYGYDIALNVSKIFGSDSKKAETLITKGLGVLQVQGLYSFGLFCVSRSNSEIDASKEMKNIIQTLLKHKGLQLIKKDDLLEELREKDGLGSKLDELIMANELVEKTLIYSRYHAKSLTRDKKAHDQKTSSSGSD